MNSGEIDAAVAVMKAAADGADIEFRLRYRCVDEIAWSDAREPVWDWHTLEYRVKPVTTKVELLAYIDMGGALIWIDKRKGCVRAYARVPSEDKTILIEVLR